MVGGSTGKEVVVYGGKVVVGVNSKEVVVYGGRGGWEYR